MRRRQGRRAGNLALAAVFAGTGLASGAALADAARAPLSSAQALFDAAPAADRTILAQADKPAAPGSRDELFGLKPAPGAPAFAPGKPTITGFYDLEVAYTYSDPSHWSRAVNRLQLSAQGEFGGGVKWKIGARGDLDPVYMTSNFYLSDVKNDQRANLFWRETYLDFSAGGWDFRVGAQNVVWGDVVGFFVADVVSPRDLREFLLPSFDIIRAPQWAVRA